MSRIRKKVQSALCVLLLLVLAILVNYLAREYTSHVRVDLTSSARWTLAEATQESLANMQRRFEETVRKDEEGQKRRLNESEKNDLRVRLELYVTATPPPEFADLFRETENRIEDLRAAAGDFLRVDVHRLDPERSRLDIERAEQEGLTPIPNLDEKGRAERLWCGVVLRYAERLESAKNALSPFDVEAWFVRHLDSFLETEPASVCVLAEQDLHRTPLARPGLEELQAFQQDLNRWIQKQYPNLTQGSPNAQEAQQEMQRLNSAHAPEVLAKDLRYLMRGAVTVRMLTRLDASNKLPDDCRLLVLMRPAPATLGAEGVEQIANYLRRGGNVLAFVPRYEPTDLQQAQFRVNQLGELGNYLEELGVRVRSEVVAQQAPSVEMQAQQQGQAADTVGRRRARSNRLPFLLRLDRPDPAARSTANAVEIALLKGVRDAIAELRATANQLKATPRADLSELLGDFEGTLELWGAVWAAEERGAPAVEDEQGLWPPIQTQQRLESLRQRLELRREDLASEKESQTAAELALRDIEAQIAGDLPGASRATLELERQALIADLAVRKEERERLEHLLQDGDAIQLAANFVRKSYLTWRQRFELSGEAQRQSELSRRAFVRELRSSMRDLEQGRPLSSAARDAVDNWLSSFDLLHSFDAYRGGPRAVVEAIATNLPVAEPSNAASAAEGSLLLRGPRSLVEGLTNAFLLWTNPIELDAQALDVVDGSAEPSAPPAEGLRATVVARSANQARYAEGPSPLGASRYLQSMGFMGTPSWEKAMMLEAMDPAKRSEELEGSYPLIVALEGRFPAYSGARDARALLDAVRRIASPPWLGGPLTFEDDVDAPVFELSGGWKRSVGGPSWTIDELGALARNWKEKTSAAEKSAAGSDASVAANTSASVGRFIVVPNLNFATTAGMGLVAQATQGREITSPLMSRLLEVALYGKEARYQGYDQRARDARRRLADFQREETLASKDHRASELWRETLLTAAASSTYFEGEAGDRAQQGGGMGLQVQNDPLGNALEKMLSGERDLKPSDDDAEARKKRGLDGVVLDIEDGIVDRAESRETKYRMIGVFCAPAVLLTLLLLSLLLGWMRYR